jgi:hypothetical protein
LGGQQRYTGAKPPLLGCQYLRESVERWPAGQWMPWSLGTTRGKAESNTPITSAPGADACELSARGLCGLVATNADRQPKNDGRHSTFVSGGRFRKRHKGFGEEEQRSRNLSKGSDGSSAGQDQIQSQLCMHPRTFPQLVFRLLQKLTTAKCDGPSHCFFSDRIS